ncbi:MAG: hypothetical protein JNK15_08665, partial [Planctomycetes bacterium]|nr:hypothetical protein [Planctomycetota bacterium]
IPVQTDIHSSFELRVGHTPVHPNYAVDPFSALPVAPSSGLNLNFAANAIAAAPPQVLYQGSYVVNPLDQLPGGYMPFPMFASFAYDGVSSLLLEFRVGPGTANGSNGGVVRLMVQSSPDPFGRVFASGTPANPVVPGQVAVATQGDNTMHDLELEFTRVETFCQSPWLDSGVAAPDYRAPIVAASLPAGTGVQLQFRGAQNAAGANPTDWAASPDGADGQRWLQFRLVFVANAITGERPVVDTLVVPF